MLVLYFICAVLYYKCCDIEYRDDNIRVLLSTLCIVQFFFLVLFVMNAILVYNTTQNEHFQSILNSERYLDECCGAAIITRVECVGPTIGTTRFCQVVSHTALARAVKHIYRDNIIIFILVGCDLK